MGLSKKYSEWKLTIIGECEENYRLHLENNYDITNVEILGDMSHDDAKKWQKQRF